MFLLTLISLMHLAVCGCCAISGCWSYLDKSLEHHWSSCFNWPGFGHVSWRKGKTTSPQFSSCDNAHSQRMGWNICKVCIQYLCQIWNINFDYFSCVRVLKLSRTWFICQAKFSSILVVNWLYFTFNIRLSIQISSAKSRFGFSLWKVWLCRILLLKTLVLLLKVCMKVKSKQLYFSHMFTCK